MLLNTALILPPKISWGNKTFWQCWSPASQTAFPGFWANHHVTTVPCKYAEFTRRNQWEHQGTQEINTPQNGWFPLRFSEDHFYWPVEMTWTTMGRILAGFDELHRTSGAKPHQWEVNLSNEKCQFPGLIDKGLSKIAHGVHISWGSFQTGAVIF